MKTTNHPTYKFGNLHIQETAMLCNTIVTGGIGAGKTGFAIYPFIDQFLKEHNEEAGRENGGMLLLDVKGEFQDAVTALMRRHGRDPEKDLVVINPDNPDTYRYNPINPEMSHIQIAGRFRSILNNLGGGGGDSFWLDSSEKVIANALLLIRICHEWDKPADQKKYASLSDVGRAIADHQFLDRLITEANNKATCAKPPPDTASRQERLEFEDKIRNIQTVVRYFEREWKPMAGETKSGICAAVANQLLRGFADAKLQRIFCETTDFSLYDICNKGKIVILQAPGWGMTAVTIGMFLKMDFQQCMKFRLSMPGVNSTRMVAFVCDEYQDYVTAGGKNEGDETFYAVSRQTRTINFVATQSYESLYAKIKDENSTRVLLQNMRVKVCLNGEDARTEAHLADLITKIDRDIQATWLHTNWNRIKYLLGVPAAVYSTYCLKTHVETRFESGTNMNSSYSEAIVFNGAFAKGERIYAKVELKPIWIPKDEIKASRAKWDADNQRRQLIGQQEAEQAARAATAIKMPPKAA